MTPEKPQDRTLDATALKALAHPLRVDLFDRLVLFGPATASQLADQLGESSGATSYHLRQLAKHGFIEEDRDRGTAREKFWRVVPGGLTMNPADFDEGSAEFEAGTLVARQMVEQRYRHADAFMRRGLRDFDADWVNASAFTSARATLTAAELDEANTEIFHAITAVLDRYRGRDHVPGSRTVVLHYNAFPVVGAPEPEDS